MIADLPGFANLTAESAEDIMHSYDFKPKSNFSQPTPGAAFS
jgi:hypothetical protein